MSGATGPGSSALPSCEGSRSENREASTQSGQAADPILYPRSEQPEASSRMRTGAAVDPNEAQLIELSMMTLPLVSPDVVQTHASSVSSASSRPASIITDQEPPTSEAPVQESSARDTSVTPNSSSLTAVSTVEEQPNRQRRLQDVHVSPTTSRPTTITTAEETPFPNDSRLHLVDSTRDSQSFSVHGQPFSENSVSDDRDSTRTPTHVSRVQILKAPHRLTWWKPWKIRSLWLSILLIVTVFFVITILTLVNISNEEQGFTPLWNPPGFFARLPAFENNIWTQGVLYTSLPAFFMTLYSLMFSSTVTMFMDLQPYMDLAKPDGASARTTIMLNYR